MRIIIDTDMQAIIVPESYYQQVDRLNEVIVEAGGKPLDYREYIRTCFEKTYAKQIICRSDVPKMKGAGKRRMPAEARSQTKNSD